MVGIDFTLKVFISFGYQIIKLDSVSYYIIPCPVIKRLHFQSGFVDLGVDSCVFWRDLGLAATPLNAEYETPE